MLPTKGDIENWLNNMNIHNYIINDNLVVDVYESIYLKDKNLNEIPIQFGEVAADFDISDNDLTSLKGCPILVGGNFACFSNPLYSLKYCPKEIKGSFYLSNTLIENLKLEDLPNKIGYYLITENNKCIENLFENNKTNMYKLQTLKSILLKFKLESKISIKSKINKKIKV